MNQKVIKPMVQGAVIVSVYAVLALVNLYTGSLLDVLLCYIMVLPMTWYTKTYSIKESVVVVLASFFVLMMVSEIFFVFFSVPTLIMGIFYGEALKRGLSTRNTYIGLLIISAIKNYFIFFILGNILGMSLQEEGIELYHEVLSLFPWLQNIITADGVFVLMWVFIFIFEAYIVMAYSNLFLNRIIKKK